MYGLEALGLTVQMEIRSGEEKRREYGVLDVKMSERKKI
jgi:hypothetical protein